MWRWVSKDGFRRKFGGSIGKIRSLCDLEIIEGSDYLTFVVFYSVK